ncbi:AAA family ATPase [Prevotella sp.]|uniref:AAA family ATPase n=1 Tax=Prevotella sp. TaxID=59823 RepID=UPI004028781D
MFVNRLLRTKIHIVLNRSNAKLLNNDLSTHLIGRSSEIALYPFSFAEYCTTKSIDTKSFNTKDIAIRRGAFDE